MPIVDGLGAYGGLQIGRHYADAPIREAIVEFRVTPIGAAELNSLEGLNFFGEGQQVRPIFRGSAEIEVDPSGGSPRIGNVDQSYVGFSYEDAEQERLIQVGLNFFTFIWRAKYTNWNEFLEQVESCWTVFRNRVVPQSVDSMGVRFVNVISLPARAVEIRDYLRLSIDIPSALPQAISNWFTQVDIPMPEFDASVTLTTGLSQPAPDLPSGGLLLDIDVTSQVQIAVTDETFDGLVRARLEDLRTAKNLVFEACITDATRDRIDNGAVRSR